MVNYNLFIEKTINIVGMLVDMLEKDVNESVIIAETTLVNLGAIEGFIQLVKHTESLEDSTVYKLNLTIHNLNKEIKELDRVNIELQKRLQKKQNYLFLIKDLHSALLESKKHVA